jgi:hypothetical protein
MRWIASHVFTAVALAGLFQTGAFAQDSSEILSLRTEVEGLRREIATGMTAGYDQDKKPAAAPAASGGGGCGQSCGCGNSCGCGCGTCCDSCCNSCCQTGGTCGGFEPCCHCPGLWVSAELMWFRYHRADGVRVGVNPGEQAEFDFEITPRFTVGWVGEDGLGARVRYWEFDHNANADPALEPGSQVQVDTYTLDFEVFDTFCLNRNWDLELSAGIRYCDFLEQMIDADAAEGRFNSFTGFGVVAAAELRRLVGTNGAVFMRARSAILMDDKDIFNDNGAGQQVRLTDTTVGMTELAFGYDYISPLCDGSYTFVRIQAEWQNWYNFSSGFEDTANTEDFAGPADVGFGGFGIAAGWIR